MSAANENRGGGGDSTSPGLSSPPSPNSPTHQTAASTPLAHANAPPSAQNTPNHGNVGGEKAARAIGATTTSASRRPRKKKDPPDMGMLASNNINGNASTATATDGQEPVLKPKKTRAPRGTSAQFKKKQALREEEERRKAEAALQIPRQTVFAEPHPAPSLPPTTFAVGVPALPVSAQNGNNEAIPALHQIQTHHATPTTRPTSGQNYDPVRSSTVAPRASSPMAPMATSSTPSTLYKYPSASASPSIHSLIDPPNNSMPPYSFPPPLKRDNDPSVPSPPESKRPRLSPPLPIAVQQQPMPVPAAPGPALPDAPTKDLATQMDVDTEPSSAATIKATAIVKKPTPNASTAVSSSSHSPKPTRPKEPQVALSSGSGLLSGSIFGGGYDSTGPEKTAPTVVLNVRLDHDNQYVNFTRLAEERYGFNALHPRLAAQRERLARVAAAGAALENAHKNGGNSGSGDEMSVDLSDADADNSNVEMGGMNDGERILGIKSGGEGGDASEAGIVKKPRKRMMKEDMYDKEDDFIDDTELIWEEQAATSKDGFFVYSGPLVPEGEEAKVERSVFILPIPIDLSLTSHRAEGPPKRGRGGGRGRGGSTRGSARAAAGPKDAAKAPGRKPRVTKAAKEQMEREKAQRENLAPLASKPNTYPVPI